MQEFSSNNYVIAVQDSMRNITALAWDSLLATQSEPTPFMRHAYLSAMEESASASPETGWTVRVISLRHTDSAADAPLAAAAVIYIKPVSYTHLTLPTKA